MCGVYRWLRDNRLPEGFQLWRLAPQRLQGPPVTGHARAARRATPPPEQKENRYMPKRDMIGTEGEITAIYVGGVRHAEI